MKLESATITPDSGLARENAHERFLLARLASQSQPSTVSTNFTVTLNQLGNRMMDAMVLHLDNEAQEHGREGMRELRDATLHACRALLVQNHHSDTEVLGHGIFAVPTNLTQVNRCFSSASITDRILFELSTVHGPDFSNQLAPQAEKVGTMLAEVVRTFVAEHTQGHVQGNGRG